MAKRKRSEPTMAVTAMDYHRNGVMGRGFYVGIVKFTEDDVTRDMLVVRFPNNNAGEPSSVDSDDAGVLCAAFDIAQLPNIAFARGNSWRGDHFSGVMDAAIKAEDDRRDREYEASKTARADQESGDCC